MAWNILTYGDAPANPDGAPAAWPLAAEQVPDGAPVPAGPPGWQQLADADYQALIAANQDAYNAWLAALVSRLQVPARVSAHAAKITLADTASPKNQGKNCLDDVTALLPSLTTVQQIAWNDAPYLDRASPLLNALAVQIGLTSTQIDQMFITANRLVV